MAKQRWLNCWVPHRLEMLLSPAWQYAPRPLRRMLERLEIEHLRHGGLKNSELYVSFSQFVSCGVSKKAIAPMHRIGEALGLMEVIHHPEASAGVIRPANSYRLTYLPTGKAAPTDEWKRIKTKEQVEAIVAREMPEKERHDRSTKQEAA